MDNVGWAGSRVAEAEGRAASGVGVSGGKVGTSVAVGGSVGFSVGVGGGKVGASVAVGGTGVGGKVGSTVDVGGTAVGANVAVAGSGVGSGAGVAAPGEQATKTNANINTSPTVSQCKRPERFLN